MELFVWSDTGIDDYRKWCYAGDRRYIFADCVFEYGKGYKGELYEVDLDNLGIYDLGEENEYIESLETDYEKAYAIADIIDYTKETELFTTENEMWDGVGKIAG